MQAIILAGGKGTRLRPFTFVLPKPLMPVHDRPIMEVIIRQLTAAGVDDIIISVGYLHQLIRAYAGDGSAFGTPIRYSQEEAPKGTAGPIGLVEGLEGDFVLINGDTLSNVDFKSMIEYHRENGNDVTIGGYRKDSRVDLGVLELDDDQRLVDYHEKPTHSYVVSMGIYVFSDRILKEITPGAHIDVPDLLLKLRDKGYTIRTYMHDGMWLDMGRPSDFAKIADSEEVKRLVGGLFGSEGGANA